jgi:hypothetical protein
MLSSVSSVLASECASLAPPLGMLSILAKLVGHQT